MELNMNAEKQEEHIEKGEGVQNNADESNIETTKEASGTKQTIELTSKQKEAILEELTEHAVNLTAKCIGRNVIGEDEFNSECGDKVIAEGILTKMMNMGEGGLRALLEIVKEMQINRAGEILEEIMKGLEKTRESKESVASDGKGKKGNANRRKTVDEKQPQNESETWPYKKILEEGAGTIIDCIHIHPRLLHLLENNSVLSNEMVSNILCRPNRTDKARVLVEYLKDLGPKSLTAFVQALQDTQQHFLANILSARDY